MLVGLITLTVGTHLALGDKKPPPIPAGTLATAIRETLLFTSADESSQRLANIAPGREMVIVEKNGEWLRVFANTDIEESHAQDAPIFGAESAPPPISGWTKAQGVIAADTPNGDEVLFGVAANMEEIASEPHPPKMAAQQARLLYRRVEEMFPQSNYAGQAAWRAADIGWQLEKEDVFSLPSAHEKENYLREQIDDDGDEEDREEISGHEVGRPGRLRHAGQQDLR